MEDNIASGFGGGLVLTVDRAIFEDSSFERNSATTGNGGGIWVGPSSTIQLTRTIVSTNLLFGAGKGAGLFLGSYVDASLFNCEVSSNQIKNGTAYGGGIYAHSYVSLTMNGTHVLKNILKSAGHGAGIYMATATSLGMHFGDVCSNAIEGSGHGGAIGSASYSASYITILITKSNITNNVIALGNGAGVFVNHYITFAMKYTITTRNRILGDGSGGGVYFSTFTINEMH